MTFPDAVKICFNKYVDFNGRARRSEFWYWVLFTVLVGIVAGIIDSILGTRNSSGTGLIGSLADLALLLPSLAVGARRLHDLQVDEFAPGGQGIAHGRHLRGRERLIALGCLAYTVSGGVLRAGRGETEGDGAVAPARRCQQAVDEGRSGRAVRNDACHVPACPFFVCEKDSTG